MFSGSNRSVQPHAGNIKRIPRVTSVRSIVHAKRPLFSRYNRLICLADRERCMASSNLFPERRPLTYTPIYKTPPQRRKKDRVTDDAISPEKRPIVQHGLDLPPDPILADCLPTTTINYPQNHVSQSNTYSHPPTMADFKQMAMDAYNQRNNQNVSSVGYYRAPISKWTTLINCCHGRNQMNRRFEGPQLVYISIKIL